MSNFVLKRVKLVMQQRERNRFTMLKNYFPNVYSFFFEMYVYKLYRRFKFFNNICFKYMNFNSNKYKGKYKQF